MILACRDAGRASAAMETLKQLGCTALHFLLLGGHLLEAFLKPLSRDLEGIWLHLAAISLLFAAIWLASHGPTPSDPARDIV